MYAAAKARKRGKFKVLSLLIKKSPENMAVLRLAAMRKAFKYNRINYATPRTCPSSFV